VLLTSLPII